jgi:hypothetical protein
MLKKPIESHKLVFKVLQDLEDEISDDLRIEAAPNPVLHQRALGLIKEIRQKIVTDQPRDLEFCQLILDARLMIFWLCRPTVMRKSDSRAAASIAKTVRKQMARLNATFKIFAPPRQKRSRGRKRKG